MSVVPTTLLDFYRALLELTRAPTPEVLDEVLRTCGQLLAARSVGLELTAAGGTSRHRTWPRSSVDPPASRRVELRVPIRIGIGAPIAIVRIEREHQACSPEEQAHLDLLAHHLSMMAERFDQDLVQRSVPDELEQVQRRRTFAALSRHDGNVAATARELGVSRTSVYRIAHSRRSGH